MAAEEGLEIGNISFNIQRYSTLTDKIRRSQLVKIGQHSWNLDVRLVEDNKKTFLSVNVSCNTFVVESSWLCQAKYSIWIPRGKEKFNFKEGDHEFTNSWFSRGFSQFVNKSEIPGECIENDTLTVEADILIIKQFHPKVAYGSPQSNHVATFKEIMQQKIPDPAVLFNNEIFCDVVFFVGPKAPKLSQGKIYGHRSIISLSSPVFAEMLFPSKSTNSDPLLEVVIEDVHPTALLSILRFIYKKEIVIDRKFIEETLYAAQKFDVKNFVESLGFLVTTETVLDFVPFVNNMGERHDLYDRCNFIVDSYISVLVDQEGFLNLEDAVMESILSSDYLQIDELHLFNAYLKWAGHQCKKRCLAVNDQSLRKVMQDLRFIRFPIMDAKEFATGPASLKLLKPEEIVSIYGFICAKIKTSFSTKNRNY